MIFLFTSGCDCDVNAANPNSFCLSGEVCKVRLRLLSLLPSVLRALLCNFLASCVAFVSINPPSQHDLDDHDNDEAQVRGGGHY